MNPQAFKKAQVERYRQMTGEQRLLIGLRLHELACEIARDAIRVSFPNDSPNEIEERLQLRLQLAYEGNTNGPEKANKWQNKSSAIDGRFGNPICIP